MVRNYRRRKVGFVEIIRKCVCGVKYFYYIIFISFIKVMEVIVELFLLII